MKKERVVVLGSGGHAKVVIDILEQEGRYEIFGVLSNDEIVTFCNYKVLGGDNYLPQLQKNGINNIAIGVGGFKNNDNRKKIFEKLKVQNFRIVNCIHPSSIISPSVKLGEGVTIFAGVILNPGVNIANNCIIATGSIIDHETVIKDHCLISAGVVIGANVVINEESLCALGCKIVSHKTIGRKVLIAAGAVVVTNITDSIQVFGVPAKSKYG